MWSIDHGQPRRHGRRRRQAYVDHRKMLPRSARSDYVIKDLAFGRQGLLLLTREGLFLSRGVKGDSDSKVP